MGLALLQSSLYCCGLEPNPQYLRGLPVCLIQLFSQGGSEQEGIVLGWEQELVLPLIIMHSAGD